MAQYQHEPLRSQTWIRFIKIHSELSKNGNICCTLQQFDGASINCPAYVALSYMWGNPAPRYNIHINGQNHMVHENLWQFLHRSWLNHCTDWLWTDSLCIDQTNRRELNEQVVRMGDIYSRAHHVVSWLGESKTGAQALRTMIDFEGAESLSGSDRASPAAANQLRRAWLRLIEEEPYWERAWVFQEVVCARKSSVVYGPVDIGFDEFLRCILIATRSVMKTHDKPRDLEELQRSWPGKLSDLRSSIIAGRRLEFMDLLTKMSQGKCTRSVDRVYGLLGLAGRLDCEFDAKNLAVDYGKDLDDVWWDVLFTVLNAPADGALQVRDVTRTVNVALGRGAYEKAPKFDDSNLQRLSAKGQKRAQLTCRIAHILAEENRHVWLAPPVLKEATKHVCIHTHQIKSEVGKDTSIALCLLASLKQPIWSMLARCSVAKVCPMDGVSWLCSTHVSNRQNRQLTRCEGKEEQNEPLDDLLRQRRGACDSSLTSISASGCNYSRVALELKEAGIVFFLTRTSDGHDAGRDFSVVEWCCMFCEED